MADIEVVRFPGVRVALRLAQSGFVLSKGDTQSWGFATDVTQSFRHDAVIQWAEDFKMAGDIIRHIRN
ncbi:hypothetical protein A5747_12885 [Mycobacterium sp. IS-836]|nr:hypothetical protein A5736_13435 [Mycobacterium sp. SP-6446]OMC55576.1 hypothetical protein A5747_12885 [Mycobacterium sp. IS-836]